ncbi:sensor domain-containing protein [Streptomyces sp. NPDC048595]|uniref:sensor domain-containing protein n=1 Tax=Streptomyces sp. NPDC048595 TaxID=3365576 RepID=UPI00371ACFBB
MSDGTSGAAARSGATGRAGHDDGARPRRGGGLVGGLLAPGRGLVLMLLGWTATVVSWLLVTAIITLFIWVGFVLVPLAAKALRALADCQLRLGRRWYGIGPGAGAGPGERHPGALDPAAEAPGAPEPAKGALGALGVLRRRSTWRDWAWAHISLVAGWFLAVVPLLLVGSGLFGILMPVLWDPWVSTWDNSWYGFIRLESARSANWAAGLGVVWLLLGLWIGPYALRAQAKLARAVLGR